MKKVILIILLFVLLVNSIPDCLFSMGALRGRYGPTFWRAISGGIELVSGNVTITSGNVVIGGSLNYGVDTQANDTYVVTIPGLASYATGQAIFLDPNNANTDGCTLNINSLGAKAIEGQDGSALTTNDILATGIYLMVYDGTNFLLQE